MATYYATLPIEIGSLQVFDGINSEIIDAMEGISVAAYGDERMGDFFSPKTDEVFRACDDPADILNRVRDGASIGRLRVRSAGWEVSVFRDPDCRKEDDKTVTSRDSYSINVSLCGKPGQDIYENAKGKCHNWMGLLESGTVCRGTTTVFGASQEMPIKTETLHWVARSEICRLLTKMCLGQTPAVTAFGEIQETRSISHFQIDLRNYGFKGQYSVYSESPPQRTTNYPLNSAARLCAIVDAIHSGVIASVGRRYCAFQCNDGRTTRTLEGNQFDVYKTKTKRALTISFEQYSDEDPPVRAFSGGVRKRLAQLGISI